MISNVRTPYKPTLRSPLRYPGGKTRGAAEIFSMFPPGIHRLCSPFVGGGSIELLCAERGIHIFAYDAFEPLVNFWQAVLFDAPAVARAAKQYLPLSPEGFGRLQKGYPRLKARNTRAAAFYALNRASFSGTTFSGGMSTGHPRFTSQGLERLANFRVDCFNVGLADFRDTLARHPNDFLYLDPPYPNGGKLYGTRGDRHAEFAHEELAALLRKREGWVLSYNDTRLVRELYAGHEFRPLSWAYGMNKTRKSNEMVILSRDLEGI